MSTSGNRGYSGSSAGRAGRTGAGRGGTYGGRGYFDGGYAAAVSGTTAVTEAPAANNSGTVSRPSSNAPSPLGLPTAVSAVVVPSGASTGVRGMPVSYTHPAAPMMYPVQHPHAHMQQMSWNPNLAAVYAQAPQAYAASSGMSAPYNPYMQTPAPPGNYYNPYMTNQSRNPNTGTAPTSSLMNASSSLRSAAVGIPSANTASASAPSKVIPPRKKNISVITDKYGNKLDFTIKKEEDKSKVSHMDKEDTSISASANTSTPAATVPIPSTSTPTTTTSTITAATTFTTTTTTEKEADKIDTTTTESKPKSSLLEQVKKMLREKEEAASLESKKDSVPVTVEEEKTISSTSGDIKHDIQPLDENLRKGEGMNVKSSTEMEQSNKDYIEKVKSKIVFSRSLPGTGTSLSNMMAKLELKDSSATTKISAESLTATDKLEKRSNVQEESKHDLTAATAPLPMPTPPTTERSSSSPLPNHEKSTKEEDAEKSLRPGGLRPGAGTLRPGGSIRQSSSETTTGHKTRRVYTKEELMAFRDLDICCCRPEDLTDMTIMVDRKGGDNRNMGRGGGVVGGGRGQWARQSLPMDQKRSGRGEGGEWSRAKVRFLEICILVMH